MTGDQAARDVVRSDLDATLFVEAGAGTGKTTALVGRVVELVTSGVPMRHIAAITFTERAAAELRDRVRYRLEEAAQDGTVSRQSVAEVDEAAISTLHSFAQRLISDHPLEADLPPAVEVLDEIASSLEFDERWRRFVDQLFSDPAYERVLLRGFATAFNVDLLRDVAAVFGDQRDRLPTSPRALPVALVPVDASCLVSAMRAAAALAEHCTSGTDLLLARIASYAAVADELEATEDEVDLLRLVQSLDKLNCTNGRAGNWSCGVDEVRQATAEAAQARCDLLDAVRRDLLRHLLEAVRWFTVRSAEERHAQGRLEFHDLLVAARDLLRNAPRVRAELHDRFTHLLIDEFQDTDPLQVELAVLLATGDEHAEARPWRELALEPGRLFFVGDAQQSIYRFRRADIGLFLEVKSALADAELSLTTNFRSVPGVVAWVNAVFGRLFGGCPSGAQPPFHALLAHRDATVAGPAVLRLGGDPVERGSVAELRAVEAAEIAATVHEAVGNQWVIGDVRADGGRRAARYDDIAILLPTRTSLAQLEQALEDADVPYRVDSSSLVWGTQQVRELLSVLRAIDDPADEIALVAALRSPALACSDDDLLSYRVAGGAWKVTSRDPEVLPDTHPVLSAKRLLRRLHDDRWWTGVSDMVERVARELGFFELGFAHRRPRDHWRRLRFVLDQSRAFEETPGATMRGFLDRAEHQITDDVRVREPVLPESDDDAVRILTVHGAKGLEFPIVVLTGLNVKHTGSRARVLWDDVGDHQARLGKSFCTAGFDALRNIEREMDGYERLRLLYVAATRARDRLVISTHRLSGSCDAKTLVDAVAESEADALWERFEPTWTLSAPPAPAPAPEPADLPGARQQWDAQRRDLVERSRRMSTRAATAISGAVGHQIEETDDVDTDLDATPRRPGGAGTSIGRAVHATLQSVALTEGADPGSPAADVAAVAGAQAAAEGIDHLAGEVTTLATAALGSDVVRQAATRRHWRELYVGAPVGDTLIEGFIDLLFEDDSGLVIIDYKTDAVGSESDVELAVERYRPQLAAYALALEVSIGRPVGGAALLFVSGGQARTRWVHDLPQAVAEVRRLLDGTGRSGGPSHATGTTPSLSNRGRG